MPATRETASYGGGKYVLSSNHRTLNQAARLFTRWLLKQATRRQTAVWFEPRPDWDATTCLQRRARGRSVGRLAEHRL